MWSRRCDSWLAFWWQENLGKKKTMLNVLIRQRAGSLALKPRVHFLSQPGSQPRCMVATLLNIFSQFSTTMAAQQERTFIMVKPDGVHRGLIGDIVKRFEQKGFKLVAMKLMHVSRLNSTCDLWLDNSVILTQFSIVDLDVEQFQHQQSVFVEYVLICRYKSEQMLSFPTQNCVQISASFPTLPDTGYEHNVHANDLLSQHLLYFVLWWRSWKCHQMETFHHCVALP